MSDDVDNRPWESPGAERRDWLPHRGDMLLYLGKMSFFLGWLSLALCFTGIMGLPLGVLVGVWATHDVRQIRASEMSPAGEAFLLKGRRYALAGLLLSCCGLTLWGLIVIPFLI
jgi:hypothetical protein